jgi:hypothetical protein
MIRKPFPIAFAIALVLSLPLAGPADADDSAGDVPEATRTKVLTTIKEYVERDVAIKQSFLIVDSRTGEPLKLAFDHVHQGVKPEGGGYLACVDFKDAAGKVYDVDVVVDVAGAEPRVTAVHLHKIGGEAVTGEQQ